MKNAKTEKTVEIEAPAIIVPWDAPVRTGVIRSDKNRALIGTGRSLFTTINHGGKETDVYLGEYAKDTSIVRNADLIAMTDAALTDMGLEFTRTIISTDLGRQMVAFYTIQSITFKGPDGRDHALRLKLENSYNGVRRLIGAVQALRLICLNGCVSTGFTFAFAQRHSSRIDLASVAQILSSELEAGPAKIEAGFRRLAEVPITDEQGLFVLRNMFKLSHGKFSGLTARRIETLWTNPTEDERGDTRNTLLGLHTSGTRFFRDIESTKVELVERSAGYFALALDTVSCPDADALNKRKALLAPVEFDAVYSRDTE